MCHREKILHLFWCGVLIAALFSLARGGPTLPTPQFGGGYPGTGNPAGTDKVHPIREANIHPLNDIWN